MGKREDGKSGQRGGCAEVVKLEECEEGLRVVVGQDNGNGWRMFGWKGWTGNREREVRAGAGRGG